MTTSQLDAWVAALSEELDLDLTDVDVELLLDVARDAAHSVTRPAAPLTTFLVGYAVGRGGMTAAEASATAAAFARRWTEEMPG
ncbi:DUF6457 domain-containing protein [Demequina aestuarii]|uniref:DUF6457 domain-containing protein n=1 Tax=Demequina aestuarii TaxID=327095 RepID=UPI0007862A15|nr:DUF6457 domain-containing protein [Demequina aestuarii]